jgi:hypothetical protein
MEKPKGVRRNAKEMNKRIVRIVGGLHIRRPGYLGFSMTVLTVGILSVLSTSYADLTSSVRILAWILLLLGVIVFSFSVYSRARAYRRDKERNYRCPDCKGLLIHVGTYGCGDRGERVDGYGFYCRKCKGLKGRET